MSKEQSPTAIDINALGVAIATALAATLPTALRKAAEPAALDPHAGRKDLDRVRHANDGLAQAFCDANYGGLPAREARHASIRLRDPKEDIAIGVIGATLVIARTTASGPQGVVVEIIEDLEAEETVRSYLGAVYDRENASALREGEGSYEHKAHFSNKRERWINIEGWHRVGCPIRRAIIGKAPTVSDIVTYDDPPAATVAAE